MTKYTVIEFELNDYKPICIGNTVTDRVLCHFVSDTHDEFIENSKIAHDICDFLNNMKPDNKLKNSK